MKKILLIALIIALFSMSVVYAEQTTTETFHVTDKRVEFAEYKTMHIIHTLEYGDITVDKYGYNKIRINDTITIELYDNSHADVIEINGQPYKSPV